MAWTPKSTNWETHSYSSLGRHAMRAKMGLIYIFLHTVAILIWT